MITAVGAIRARCSTTRTARLEVSPIPSSSSTAESQWTTPARSSPPGTLQCARATSGAWLLAAKAAAPLGSDRLDLSDLAHLVVVVLPLAVAELADLVQEARLPAL